MNIRQATLQDKDAIISLYCDYVNEVMEFDHEAPPSDRIWDTTLKSAVEDGEPVFLAVLDGDPIGALAWIEISDQRLYDLFVYVVPKFRRQGIAAKLLNTARQFARNKGFKSVFDTVSLLNKPAVKMMASIGLDPAAYAYTYTP